MQEVSKNDLWPEGIAGTPNSVRTNGLVQQHFCDHWQIITNAMREERTAPQSAFAAASMNEARQLTGNEIWNYS